LVVVAVVDILQEMQLSERVLLEVQEVVQQILAQQELEHQVKVIMGVLDQDQLLLMVELVEVVQEQLVEMDQDPMRVPGVMVPLLLFQDLQ
jgi:hypothetical protein